MTAVHPETLTKSYSPTYIDAQDVRRGDSRTIVGQTRQTPLDSDAFAFEADVLLDSRSR